MSSKATLSEEIIDIFRETVGNAWDRMSKDDVETLKQCAKDAAKLHAKQLTEPDPALTKEIQIVNASLTNLTVANIFHVRRVFWESVQRAAALSLSVLVKTALTAIV